MKPHIAIICLVCLLIITSAYAQVVDIPDPNLRGAIREALQLPDGQPITQQQMLQVRVLKATDKDISDLTGLEHATNLTQVAS